MVKILATSLLYMFGQAFLLVVLAPYIAGLIKKVKARLQNRRGPDVFQVYYDLRKLLLKDSVVSTTTSWIFLITPFIYFATAFGGATLVPGLTSLMPGISGRFVDLFMLLYLFVVGRFFLALASLDTGSAFGGMGGAREMFIAVLVEPIILLVLLTVAFRAHSPGLEAMANAGADGSSVLAVIFAAVAFFIVLIAETGRIPVDNPDTHLELTMVHEGMVLEYSGRRLGLIVWATAIKQLVLIVLFSALFLPWPSQGWPFSAQIIMLIGKVLICAVAIALSETLINKMRLFKIPSFLAVAGLLALLAIVAQ